MRRAFLFAALLLPGLAFAGGGIVVAPPVINIQPQGQVLDPNCVDRLKGHGASAARAAHECRKAYNPGTPPPQALREKSPAEAATAKP